MSFAGLDKPIHVRHSQVRGTTVAHDEIPSSAGRSEKGAVVFDIGKAYTKSGYAGECHPRSIIKSKVTKWDHEQRETTSTWIFSNESSERDPTPEEMETSLTAFFHQLYYKELLVTPRERRVVIVESFLCPSNIRDLIARILFDKYLVPSILFAPSHLLSVFTVGAQTALVIDVGYSEAIVLPVCEGIPIITAYQSAPLGAKAVHQKLKQLLVETAVLTNRKGEEDSLERRHTLLTDEVLEDIKVRACFVAPKERAVCYQAWIDAGEPLQGEGTSQLLPAFADVSFQYPLPQPCINPAAASPEECGLSLTVHYRVRELACEVLFAMDNERTNLATLALDALKAVPIDLRKQLAENIIFIGGTCQLPGFKPRFQEELLELVKGPIYEGDLSIDCFKFHSPPSKENYTAWLGGAMFGSLDILSGRSISREAYDLHRKIPDWTDTFEHAIQVTSVSTQPGRH